MADPAQTVRAPQVSFERERGVYQVQIQSDLSHFVVSVVSGGSKNPQIFNLFQLISNASIPIFLAKLHSSAVTFAAEKQHVESLQTLLSSGGFVPEVKHDLVLLTVLATSMRDLTGVMVDIADAIGEGGARIIGVGDSHNSVQCLIAGDHADEAVSALHRKFHLETAS